MKQRVILISLAVVTVGLLAGSMLADMDDPMAITATILGCALAYLILRWRGQTPAGAREIAARNQGKNTTH